MLGVVGDVGPRLVLVGVHALHSHLFIVGVEAHDLLSDTGGTTVLGLVTEVKNLLSRGTPSIVHDALSHDTDHGTLARVYITNDCDSHVI